MKTFGILTAVFGFLAVALGAFAAHGLKAKLSADLLEVFRTGVDYQFYHVFALGLVFLLLRQGAEGKALDWAGVFFAAGIVIFSGSLYAIALTGVRKFGAITPIGGFSFLAGWFCLLIHAWKRI